MSLTPSSPEPLPRGLYFEEHTLGATYDSHARTLGEADITLFAGLSGDYNPMHVDQVRAERSAFRGRIAHGLLVESVASGLAMQTGIFHGKIAALMEMTIRYHSAVRAGDTIRMRLCVSELDPKPGVRRAWVVFQTEVLNQRAELVLDGSWKVLIERRRSQGAVPTPIATTEQP